MNDNSNVARQRTIASRWASYREQVLPVDAHAIHVSETQMAFYAGAEAFLGLVMGGLTPGEEPQDEDLEMMDRLQKELIAFARSVGEEGRPGRTRR